MIYNTIERLKEKLEQIRFGILKITGAPLLKLSRSFIIETCNVDYNGYMWCTTSESAPPGYVEGKEFPVHIKYVHKPESLFIRVVANAKIVDVNSHTVKEVLKRNNIDRNENALLLRIKIDEVHSYKKRSISACTSFLQAINIFSLKRPVLENGL